jgi:nucleoside-diphosphate-sugar epimerase
MARNAPIMKTDRARTELGWTPRYSSVEALQSVLDGLAAGQGVAGSPSLHPR